MAAKKSGSSNQADTSGGVTLGVVAISYNEQQDLPGFLENLYDWVDEIVIVDDGSQDDTAKIAHGWGEKVRFISSPRAKDEYFSHQRNKGIQAAVSEWLLHMDIDERVPPELAVEIRAAIDSPTMDGYRFRRLNFFLQRPMRGGGWQDWNLVHLARRETLNFAGMYHEEVRLDTDPGRIGQLRNKMWHLNDESYLERTEKSQYYCQEQAARLKADGIRIKGWHLLWLPLRELLNKMVRKRGYRDGVPGLLFALHAASASFRACALLWDEQNKQPRSQLEDQLRAMRSSVPKNK